jgi:hypothetical protein
MLGVSVVRRSVNVRTLSMDSAVMLVGAVVQVLEVVVVEV